MHDYYFNLVVAAVLVSLRSYFVYLVSKAAVGCAPGANYRLFTKTSSNELSSLINLRKAQL